MNWLMVQLGLKLRWTLEKPGHRWWIYVPAGEPEMIAETVRQVRRMVDEDWTVVRQPVGHPCF